MRTPALLIAMSLAVAAGLHAQRPARDRAADMPAPPAGSAGLYGYVVASDTGRPIKRARIVVASTELSDRTPPAQGANEFGAALRDRLQQMAQTGAGPTRFLAGIRVVQSAQTDEQGHYEIRGLPAGRYVVSASKTGFVTVNFGQRRPLRPGTPLQVADGQQIQNVSFVLPRGSVITGRILDEDGEPVARASVTAMRYQYQGGERRLVSAGSDQTDDRGQYRVYGLPPGDYYVSAVSRLLNRPVERLLQAVTGQAAPGDEEDSLGYAPTYYPGVATAAEAARVTAGLGQEVGNIDFQLQLVNMARVSGTVYGADGAPLSGGAVVLMPGDGGAAARVGGITGRARADGAFTIDNVPPGQYTLYARSRPGRDAPPDYAVMAVSVAGQDLPNLAVALSPGATISGSIVIDTSGASGPRDLSGFRVTVPSIDPIPFGGSQPARVAEDGTFAVSGIPAGRHAIRSPNPPAPWALKAVMVDGRDVADTPIEVRNGQKITQAQLIFTDRVTELSGAVKDERGAAALGFTVIAFSTDPGTWRAQSRTIQAAQPDQTGAFRIRGLPPGTYYLVASDDVEQGEWFDPSFLDEAQKSATRVTLTDGQVTAQDVTVRTGG
jgi:hypothetical protein